MWVTYRPSEVYLTSSYVSTKCFVFRFSTSYSTSSIIHRNCIILKLILWHIVDRLVPIALHLPTRMKQEYLRIASRVIKQSTRDCQQVIYYCQLSLRLLVLKTRREMSLTAEKAPEPSHNSWDREAWRTMPTLAPCRDRWKQRAAASLTPWSKA